MLLKWQQQLLQQDSARAGRNISLWPILLGQNNSDPIPNSPLFPRKLIQQSACAEVSSNTTYSEHQYPNFDHTRSQPATTVTDMMEDKVGGFVSNLCSPSTLATRLGLIPTPQREAYISSLLSNAKCSETFHQVIEPAQRSLNFAITPRTLPQPPTSHPFHHHLPHYNNGQHRNVGKDVMTFNLCRASKAAANEQKNKIIKTYLTTGSLSQRRHALHLFLTDKRIVKDTKSIIEDIVMDKEIIAALKCLRSMKMMLSNIFRSCIQGRISNNKRAMVNVLSACILNDEVNNHLSASSMGKQAGLSKHFIHFNKSKSFEKARLISAGDKRGFEFIEADQTRSKFKEEQLSMFEQWIIKDCELVKQNPLKNDMIIQRDRRGKVVLGHNNQPIMIQKMLLMSSYRELHLYMIDNYRDMMMDNGTVLFSECTLRKIMPR
jgi:hypothetical protein